MIGKIIEKIQNQDRYIFECSMGYGFFEYSNSNNFNKGDFFEGTLNTFGDCIIKKVHSNETYVVYIQCYDSPSISDIVQSL